MYNVCVDIQGTHFCSAVCDDSAFLLLDLYSSSSSDPPGGPPRAWEYYYYYISMHISIYYTYTYIHNIVNITICTY